MCIWLGYPEEREKPHTTKEDKIVTLFEEIEAKDEAVGELQAQLVVELITRDSALKLREKRDFAEAAELGTTPEAITHDTPWPEIISEYEKVWTRVSDESVKIELEKKRQLISGYPEHSWRFGGGNGVPIGQLTATLQERLVQIYTGNVKAVIDKTATALTELATKMEALEEELAAERKEIGFGNGAGAGMDSQANKVTNRRNSNASVTNVKAIRIDTVTNITTTNNRWLIEHKIPGGCVANRGFNTSIVQDLGRAPVRVSFKGVLTSNTEDRHDLQKKIEVLKWFFNRQKPLFFSSRLVNQIESSKVIIENLSFEESSKSPYIVEFCCTLREYNDPEGPEAHEEPDTKFKLHIKHWSDFQILNAVTKYRNSFIANREKITTTKLSEKLARAIIVENKVIKNRIGI